MKVAIYIENFLTPSMTFVHRQLIAAAQRFDVVVIARNRMNSELFDVSDIRLVPKSALEKVLINTRKIFGVSYASTSKTTARKISQILLEEGVELVHAHFGPFGLEMLPICKRLGIPLLVTFHGYDASSLLRKKSYVRQLECLFANASVLTVSKTMEEKLSALDFEAKDISTHYIGAPTEKFDYINREPISLKMSRHEEINFLQVSNFVEKKGHKYTVLALRKVLDRHQNIKVKLVGDGPLRAGIEDAVKDLGLVDRVLFLGHLETERVKIEMDLADLFLHHSVTDKNGDQEGIPTVIMEAMASGLPVISTYHSGIEELVQHSVTGYLISERDIYGYEQAIERVLEDNGSLGREGREVVQRRFNLQLQNEVLLSKYTELAVKRHAAH